jgi:hypothetical protein
MDGGKESPYHAAEDARQTSARTSQHDGTRRQAALSGKGVTQAERQYVPGVLHARKEKNGLMGKKKFIQHTFHNVMSMKLVIGSQEVTVRECDATIFTQLVSKAIEQHSDRAAIEKELSTLCYGHKEDKWYAVNALARRGISLVDKPSQ